MRQLILALGLLTAAAASAEELAKDGDTLVVSQGTARVTLSDVDAYVHRVPRDDRAGFMNKPERIETMLRSLLLDKQLADEARKLGLDKDPIAQKQISLAIDTALARVRMEKFREGLKAPDFSEQAHEDYLANKPKYQIPRRVDVKHILIDTKSRTAEQAEALAKETAEKIARDPSQFEALVESLSDDQSKKDNHGLIENASSENFVAPFAEASAKLEKVGQISPVVRTPYGFHIIKLVKIEPAQQQPYEKVRAQIVSRLEAEWLEAQIRGKLDGLRNEKMDPQPEVLATLRERYGAPGPVTPKLPAADDAANPQ
ncbi:peptidylprolyl isomerase [Tahibacter caeni]|uniref:peptidylprolyl isomerase n=1 Tax=Tahibacter caeni TaxID=1453545 RepID=UPI0021497A26|nr:peptidylprolyl isomerase [Tahibacter caeni]